MLFLLKRPNGTISTTLHQCLMCYFTIFTKLDYFYSLLILRFLSKLWMQTCTLYFCTQTCTLCILYQQPVVSPLCAWVVPLCLPLNMQLRPSERILEKIRTLLWVRQIFFGIHVYLLVSDLYLAIVRFISITLKTLVYSNMCILIYNHIHWFIDFLWDLCSFLNFRLFMLDSLWIVFYQS